MPGVLIFNSNFIFLNTQQGAAPTTSFSLQTHPTALQSLPDRPPSALRKQRRPSAGAPVRLPSAGRAPLTAQRRVRPQHRTGRREKHSNPTSHSSSHSPFVWAIHAQPSSAAGSCSHKSHHLVSPASQNPPRYAICLKACTGQGTSRYLTRCCSSCRQLAKAGRDSRSGQMVDVHVLYGHPHPQRLPAQRTLGLCRTAGTITARQRK